MTTGKDIAIKYLNEIYASEIKLSNWLIIVCGGLGFFIVTPTLAIIYNILQLLIYWKYRVDRKKKLNQDIEIIKNLPDDDEEL